MTQHQIKACEIISSKPSFGRIKIVKKTQFLLPHKKKFLIVLKQLLPTDSSPTGVRYKYPKDFRKERDQAQATSKSKHMQTWEAFLFLQMSKNGSVSTNRNFITVHLLPCSNLVDKWVEILLTYNENFQALLRQCTHAKNHTNLWGREGNFSGTSPPALWSLSELSLLELK